MLICLTAVTELKESVREKLEKCILDLEARKADAMEPIYRIANTAVYAFAFSLLKNSYDTEDIAQDCFIRV
ncbi:MAG: hypothetical protein ACI4N0_05830 [Christensenellales bacterium]